MRVLDLFSGIGGFSLGLERAGMETVAFCEYDEKCRQVLRKHWPDVPIHEDVRTLDGRQFRGTVGLVCGGYPCQPFSVAGKREGTADDRHLWPEFFRIIRECQPTWVLAENVAGHINMGLDEVLSDLESEGYTSQPFVIPACAIDAPHRRDRGWVVGHTGKDVADPTARRLPQPEHEPRKQFTVGGTTPIGAFLTDSGWWSVEPNVGRVANGIPGRVDRLKQLGNSVVPQIPEIIGRAIMSCNHIGRLSAR